MKINEVIAACSKISLEDASDLLLACEIAVGISVGSKTDWDDSPAGFGTEIINFTKSELFSMEGTYGDIAKRFLQFRLSKLL